MVGLLGWCWWAGTCTVGEGDGAHDLMLRVDVRSTMVLLLGVVALACCRFGCCRFRFLRGRYVNNDPLPCS